MKASAAQRIALRIAADFGYPQLIRGMWRDKVSDAMKRQGVSFDLENDNEKTSVFEVKVGQYEYVDGEMLPYRFICQGFAAGGDWENPVFYYRIQVHPKSQKPSVDFLSYLADKCFVYIPIPGNGNLRSFKSDDGVEKLGTTRNGEEEGINIDERQCREDLRSFLLKLTRLHSTPEMGWEEEPKAVFEKGRLVSSLVHAGKDNAVRPGTPAMKAGETGEQSSRSAMDLQTFKAIRLGADPDDQHHLRMVCVDCGDVQTCRCSAPKTTVFGICYECAEARGIPW